MTKVLEIFKVVFASFFSNGVNWIEARKLTLDDFTVEIHESPKEKLLEWYLKGHGDYIRISIQLTMKESTIKMLDKMGYFKYRGSSKYDELSESSKRELTTKNRNIAINLGKRCTTDKGGKLRNVEKVGRIIDEAIVDARKLFEENRTNMTNTMLEDFNRGVMHVVDENNIQYKRTVLPALTERRKLDELLELNAKSDEVSNLKMEHDIAKGKLDSEIAVYKKKIAELEAEKTTVYISTRDKLFEKQMERLPDEVKEELEGKTSYPKESRGFPFN